MKTKVESRNRDKFLTNLKRDVLSFYQDKNLNNDIETNQVISFLKENPISVFPYEFSKKYKKGDINVYLDQSIGLKYVVHENKRLYFKRSMSTIGIKSLYQGLQLDQDPQSPHLYLTESFKLTSKDVIADIGSAEGNFTLSNIEKVSKAYLFESDDEWIEALEATFRPWKEKVNIINKYVTDRDSDETISMNTFYNSNPDISFFKVDIEGEEQIFLNACAPLFKEKNNFKIAICTYHKQNDCLDFTGQLSQMGFQVEHSNGFMLFVFDNDIKEPYLRRGLIRAQKN
ncbi:hypothetical protein [Flavobacterium sp.]|uniref:hypothetical protein n=1 Tax=Flavobacterium sp. TaxID=239 RepID=UPI0037508258